MLVSCELLLNLDGRSVLGGCVVLTRTLTAFAPLPFILLAMSRISSLKKLAAWIPSILLSGLRRGTVFCGLLANGIGAGASAGLSR
jgi:hypothetical protein